MPVQQVATASTVTALERYRRHRERLLREVVEFTRDLKVLETRLLASLNESTGFRTGVYGDNDPLSGKALRMEPELHVRRQRERAEFELHHDRDAIMFQRRWRVLLVASHEPDLCLSFLDDFFLEPTVEPGSPYLRLKAAYPGRFVIIDREAGRNVVEEVVAQKLKERPKGAVSRLPTKPPYRLDSNVEQLSEDIEIVRACANGDTQDDFAELIVKRLYSDVARRVGWKSGRRLPNFAPTDDAKEWKKLVRHMRRRSAQLARVLGPFDTAEP